MWAAIRYRRTQAAVLVLLVRPDRHLRRLRAALPAGPRAGPAPAGASAPRAWPTPPWWSGPAATPANPDFVAGDPEPATCPRGLARLYGDRVGPDVRADPARAPRRAEAVADDHPGPRPGVRPPADHRRRLPQGSRRGPGVGQGPGGLEVAARRHDLHGAGARVRSHRRGEVDDAHRGRRLRGRPRRGVLAAHTARRQVRRRSSTSAPSRCRPSTTS